MDAEKQHTRILSFTNFLSGRQCWSYSHFIRATAISIVLKKLVSIEDITKDLKVFKMRKDNGSLQRAIYTIRETMNLFDQNLEHDGLYSLSTGKAVTKESEHFLPQFLCIGQKKWQEFIDECNDTADQFEKRTIISKLKTFATENTTKKLKGRDGKVIETSFIRDLFGTLLCTSMGKKVDLCEVLKYPLTPYDIMPSRWLIIKSPKSALMKYID